MLGILFISFSAKSQDSGYHKNVADSTFQNTYSHHNDRLKPSEYPPKYDNVKLTPQIYRDTRLGSSSPLYNTYIKNHYGAGAVTTNPNKWGSGAPAMTSQSYFTPIDSSVIQQSVNPPEHQRKMEKRNDQ